MNTEHFNEASDEVNEGFMLSGERFTLSEAAELLGVSVPTARRLVFSKKIRAIKVTVGDRKRWEIPKSEVFRIQHEASSSVGDFTEASVMKASDSSLMHSSGVFGKLASDDLKDASLGVPLEAHLAAIELASKQIDRLHNKSEALQQQVLEAQKKVEQSERLRIAMQWQLQQYQSALSDQAESLAEERALRLTLEAQQKSVRSVDLPADLNDLKLTSPKSDPPKSQWGSRIRRWLGLKTG